MTESDFARLDINLTERTDPAWLQRMVWRACIDAGLPWEKRGLVAEAFMRRYTAEAVVPLVSDFGELA